MIEAPALPLVEHLPVVRPARPNPRGAWSSEGLHRVEIVAPDSERAALLVEYASPLFPAEIVRGRGLTVRLQPPIGTGWAIELLSLVDRWLGVARLPRAKVLYGGRSYLIRAPLDVTKLVVAAGPPALVA